MSMSEFNTGRAKTWNIYGSSNPSPSQTDVNKEGPWKSFGSSMNAISFGFVATAILISMFLIMAIFEHLFRPNASHNESSHGMESRQMQKLGNSDVLSLASSSLVLCSFFPQPSAPVVQTAHASDFSVVMPGQQYPTFIAQPAPLACRREGVYWPSHENSIV
ncbi:UNVERIFIED_CONTAM: hypothetical protein Scaly_1406500 [Sesamum calycinum]|uniref:Uncharacterized protein n=1 Tax=Sesamum calycinum TaxID=2727403 RepID=A0AAW2PMR9_9LAMI